MTGDSPAVAGSLRSRCRPSPGCAARHVSARHVAVTCRGPGGQGGRPAHPYSRPGHGAGSGCAGSLGPCTAACSPRVCPAPSASAGTGTPRDTDGSGDSDSPKARAPAQHPEYGGGLAAGQWLVPPSTRKDSSPPSRAPLCPASPMSTVGQGTGSWALSQSPSWLMSTLKGAGSSQGHAEVTHCLAQRNFSHLARPGEGI